MGVTIALAVGRHGGARLRRSRPSSACVPSLDDEEQGLDNLDHGEAGYHLDEGAY